MQQKTTTPHRVCFVLALKPGVGQEYMRRHQQVWPEMQQMLRQAGVYNYSLWVQGSQVIGYYQTKNLQRTTAAKAASAVQDKWNKYMADILETDAEGRPVLQNPQQVFMLE
ncbi:MAG: L-rhamnose mutarotase [Oscillospiraceae bacterium]